MTKNDYFPLQTNLKNTNIQHDNEIIKRKSP